MSKKIGNNVHIPTKLEEAEMAKVSENALRYVQITTAEEIKMICDAKGLNFNRVRERGR